MTSIPTVFGICAALLVGVGLYGLIVQRPALRKILAFNLVGAGVFLLFGVIGRRGADGGLGGDPVVFGLVITGIVVAFAATALAVALLLKLREQTGEDSFEENTGKKPDDSEGGG
jgi:multicomponent Na+:H+ antiporter subunit C